MIFVARDGEVIGEHPETVFAAKVRAGEIAPTDHFWSEGMADWKLVSEYQLPARRPHTVKITRTIQRTVPINMDAPAGSTAPKPEKPGVVQTLLKRLRR